VRTHQVKNNRLKTQQRGKNFWHSDFYSTQADDLTLYQTLPESGDSDLSFWKSEQAHQTDRSWRSKLFLLFFKKMQKTLDIV